MTARECLARAHRLETIAVQVIDWARRGKSLQAIANRSGQSEAWCSWIISSAWRSRLPATVVPAMSRRVYRPRRGSAVETAQRLARVA